MPTKKVITWNDVVRSTEPWKWKRILDRVTFEPIDLARAINQYIEERQPPKDKKEDA